MSETFQALIQHAVRIMEPDVSSALCNDLRFEGFFTKLGSLVAYDCGLRLFGSTNGDLPTLTVWNASVSWRAEYGELAQGLDFFAEDSFGNQFAFEGISVIQFLAETGDRLPYADSFSGWMERIVSDPDEELSLWLLRDWQARQGNVLASQHLCPKLPFVLGGTSAVDNLYALDRFESMVFKGSVAKQIKNVPSGTPIRLNIVHPDKS